MHRFRWLFPASAVGWLGLVVLTTSWPRFGLGLGLSTVIPTDLGGSLVLVLLVGTVLGGLALGGHQPDAPQVEDAPRSAALAPVSLGLVAEPALEHLPAALPEPALRHAA